MPRKSGKWIDDMRRSGRLILEYTANRDLASYHSDSMLRAAVERHFEIIGEALKRIAALEPQTAGRISDYQQIISFRNALIHGYDLVDDELVWEAITVELPKLLRELDAIADGNRAD